MFSPTFSSSGSFSPDEGVVTSDLSLSKLVSSLPSGQKFTDELNVALESVTVPVSVSVRSGQKFAEELNVAFESVTATVSASVP